MDRTHFAHSRAVIRYADQTSSGTCSIHCAAKEMRKHGKTAVASLKVADYRGKELIDAAGAFWVLGGNKLGVMTSPAKWAFARETEARKFVREQGGEIVTFDQVMKALNAEIEEMDK